MNDSGIHPDWHEDDSKVVRLDERRRRKTWPAPVDAPPAPPAEEDDAVKSQGGNA